MVVAAMVGVILVDAIASGGEPPRVSVEVSDIVPQHNGYEVRFVVRNEGDRAATYLHMEGTLMNEEETVEVALAMIDLLPAGSSVHGAMFFTNDPTRYELEIRPLGYADP